MGENKPFSVNQGGDSSPSESQTDQKSCVGCLRRGITRGSFRKASSIGRLVSSSNGFIEFSDTHLLCSLKYSPSQAPQKMLFGTNFQEEFCIQQYSNSMAYSAVVAFTLLPCLFALTSFRTQYELYVCIHTCERAITPCVAYENQNCMLAYKKCIEEEQPYQCLQSADDEQLNRIGECFKTSCVRAELANEKQEPKGQNKQEKYKVSQAECKDSLGENFEGCRPSAEQQTVSVGNIQGSLQSQSLVGSGQESL